MSSTADSKISESSKTAEPVAKPEAQPHLGVLEEDDEFEEFPVAGSFYPFFIGHHSDSILDWKDSETDLAHLGGAAPGAAKSGGDKLWEDNWDDDDIEEEFSVQLRWEWEFQFPQFPAEFVTPGMS